MRQLRNEVCYAVACACDECQEGLSSRLDFEVIGSLTSLTEARKDLKYYKAWHPDCFLVRETLEPLHQIPQQKPKRRKAA